jgi:adenosylcobinamide-GDP ribazoletransferase
VAASALVVVALAALTGALHLDGLADSADALLGGRSPEHRLEIMRDPHNGAFGFAAVGSVLVLKWAALVPLEGWLRDGSLLLVPALGRWAVLPLLIAFHPARGEGMGFDVHVAARAPGVLGATLIAAGASLAIFGPPGAALAGAALGVALLLGAVATSRLGGVTGDVLGCTVEVAETALLLLAATSAAHRWLA